MLAAAAWRWASARRLLYSWMDSLDGRWYSTVILEWRRLLEGEWEWKDFWLTALCEDEDIEPTT